MKDLVLKWTATSDLTEAQIETCQIHAHLGIVVMRDNNGKQLERKIVSVARIPTTHVTYRFGSDRKQSIKHHKVLFDWVSDVDPELFSAQYDDEQELSDLVHVEVQGEYVEVSHVAIDYWDFEQLDEE
jgi:hypothetical protein